MSLLTTADVGNHLNIDLANPTGVNVAGELIDAVQSSVEEYIGYPLEQTDYQDLFDGGERSYCLRTLAPVTGSVTAEEYSDYDDVWADPANPHRLLKANIVRFVSHTTHGFDNLRLSYSAGWDADTLPKDLRDAMLDLIGLKLQAVANFSAKDTTSTSGDAPSTGALKRVQTAEGYTEEYDTSEAAIYWKSKLAVTVGSDIPAAIKEVFGRYRLVNV